MFKKKDTNKKSKKMNRREFLKEAAKGGGYFALGLALTETVSQVPGVASKDPYSLPGGAGDYEGA